MRKKLVGKFCSCFNTSLQLSNIFSSLAINLIQIGSCPKKYITGNYKRYAKVGFASFQTQKSVFWIVSIPWPKLKLREKRPEVS